MLLEWRSPLSGEDNKGADENGQKDLEESQELEGNEVAGIEESLLDRWS